ncbi:polyprenyl synthetase family protein [Macrococcus hajekii]|uniref:Farnesyl diphosphate synthase n=1 Tax=Macrococcus hajekii TaxID=198482 RepID=A0A4R6BMN1_9STAP|nr:farnesyl diphosphate synthase [Macrococcus hajekii]TDM02932.1 polyprenyl synthetase family protein [Macrococcus hajekii]GGB05041.1 farnesyl diphosphate synthase [Macrococcus hajekii]
MKQNYKTLFENHLKSLYAKPLDQTLDEAMMYSLLAGGKRIRPVLLFSTLELLQVDPKKGLSVATAIEMIHTYSLIHDDLPAMDDDDYRRGKLTNHKVFGEAVAILAGDGLLTDSFAQISKDESLNLEQRIQLITLISEAAGTRGMVGGQMLDIKAEESELTLEELKRVHRHKTGDLIKACFVCAGFIAEQPTDVLKQLSEIGQRFGLIFQIKDDILDVEGNFEQMGKAVGSDENNAKSTYVSLLGLEGAKEAMQTLNKETLELISSLNGDHSALNDLLQYIISREK